MKEEEKQEKEMKKILKKRAQLTIYMKITNLTIILNMRLMTIVTT